MFKPGASVKPQQKKCRLCLNLIAFILLIVTYANPHPFSQEQLEDHSTSVSPKEAETIQAYPFRLVAGLRCGPKPRLCHQQKDVFTWCEEGDWIENYQIGEITPKGTWLKTWIQTAEGDHVLRQFFTLYGQNFDAHVPWSTHSGHKPDTIRELFWLTCRELPLAELYEQCPGLTTNKFFEQWPESRTKIPKLTVNLNDSLDQRSFIQALEQAISRRLQEVGWDRSMGYTYDMQTIDFKNVCLAQNGQLIRSALSAILPQHGCYLINESTNQLLLFHCSEAFERIYPVMQALDKPLPMLRICVSLITISKSSLKQLNHDLFSAGLWKEDASRIASASLNNSQHLISLTHLSLLAKYLLELELSALESEQKVEVISRPMLMTLSGCPASFKQGKELPCGSGRKGQNIKFKEATLHLQLTAHQLSEKKIRLSIHIIQNSPTTGESGDEIPVFSIDKQELCTQAEILPGEVLLLGGLETRCEKMNDENRPGMLGIRLLTRWWDRKNSSSEQKILLLLLEAHHVDATAQMIFPTDTSLEGPSATGNPS